MWRQPVLRGLIALNWMVAGAACGQVVYGHWHVWGSECRTRARDELSRAAPGLDADGPAYQRRLAALAAEYEARSRIVATLGWYGWCFALVGGTVTALGLIAVFPGYAPAAVAEPPPPAPEAWQRLRSIHAMLKEREA